MMKKSVKAVLFAGLLAMAMTFAVGCKSSKDAAEATGEGEAVEQPETAEKPLPTTPVIDPK